MSKFVGIIKNEPADQYHAKTDYIGSSSLAQMAKSPAHFLEAWQGKNIEATPAMDRGSFMHKLLLELTLDGFAPRPKKDGRLIASNTNEYKAWLASLPPGTTPIEPELYADASAILAAACLNKKFVEFWDKSEKEVSYYGRDAATGLYIKCRHDLVAKDESFTIDVKTTADISKFPKQIFNMGYDLKQAHYRETTRAVSKCSMPKAYLFAIEQKPPYASQMFKLGLGTEISASNKWREYMNVISVCEKDKSYPGYSQEIVEVERPYYLEDNSELDFGDAV